MNLEKFTIRAQEALQEAKQLASRAKHSEIDVSHLVLALLEQKEGVVPELLSSLGVQRLPLVTEIKQLHDKKPQVEGAGLQQYPSKSLQQVLEKGLAEADQLNDDYVSTEHLFLAALEVTGSDVHQILARQNITRVQVLEALRSVRGQQRVTDQNPEDKFNAIKKYGQDLTRLARTGKLDPVIGRDQEVRRVIQVLSRRTKNNPVLIGEPGVGKTAIIEGLAQRIVDGDVPETLKGKTVISMDIGAMLAGAKYRGEFEDRFKAFLKEVTEKQGQVVLFIDELHTLVGAGGSEGTVDASNMIKPQLARGELRCVGATTLKEYRKYIEKDAALERRFQPVKVAEPNAEDAIAILRGLRERYEVHHGVKIQDDAIVAAVQLSDRYISDRFLPDKAIDLMDEAASRLRMEIDSMPTEIDAIERRVKQLEIEKQALLKDDDSGARRRLKDLEKQLASLQEELTGMKLHWQQEKELIDEIRQLTEALDLMRVEMEKTTRENQYDRAAEIKYGRIPGTEHQIEEAKKKLAELQQTQQMLKEEVTGEEIAEVVAMWTGIPVNRLLETERDKLLHMEDRLQQRVISQREAIDSVSNAVRRSRSGLQDPNRPVGSFIFMGPTGVGKTELARALAEFLFDDERAMTRVDMSEFMEKHSVSRLIGAPPGYVGYDEGGYLTEHVRRHPYSVVLFDEIEKAHQDVFNVMLQILDDGRLTDGQGRTVDFTNTIIIMTSNLGGHLIQEALHTDRDKDLEELRQQIQQLLQQHFRPEFLNRIDDTIIFHSLRKEDLNRIVEIQLRRIQKNLDRMRIRIELSDEAVQWLADQGYDPAFGARPLKRVMQKHILDSLATSLLDGSIEEGQRVRGDVNAEGSGLSFAQQD